MRVAAGEEVVAVVIEPESDGAVRPMRGEVPESLGDLRGNKIPLSGALWKLKITLDAVDEDLKFGGDRVITDRRLSRVGRMSAHSTI
jgi:hypothetical protein